MKAKIISLILFIVLSELLMFMGYYPNNWEFWAVVVCSGGISITEYLENNNGK